MVGFALQLWVELVAHVVDRFPFQSSSHQPPARLKDANEEMKERRKRKPLPHKMRSFKRMRALF